MGKRKKKKFEFSKVIIACVGTVTFSVTVFTLFYCWCMKDSQPLTYLIPAIFGELATATGFYFWKARLENSIKLRKFYGPEIYNDAKGE